MKERVWHDLVDQDTFWSIQMARHIVTRSFAEELYKKATSDDYNNELSSFIADNIFCKHFLENSERAKHKRRRVVKEYWV